jgi:acetyl esterase
LQSPKSIERLAALQNAAIAAPAPITYAAALFHNEASPMIPPLDPVVAQIIPLLPLRDPTSMTPQSARDALRGLAAARASVPPPPVASVEDIKVKGAAGFLNARAYRNSSGMSPTVVFFHGGGWVAGDIDTHDRQARWISFDTGAFVISVY